MDFFEHIYVISLFSLPSSSATFLFFRVDVNPLSLFLVK